MRFCRWVIPALFSMFSVMPVIAQEDTEGILSAMGFTRYWTMGFGGAYQEFFDESVSSIRYQGFGTTATVGHTKVNGSRYSELIIQGSYATLKRPAYKVEEIQVPSYRIAVDDRLLFHVKLRNERYDFRPGGMFSMNYGFRKLPQVANSGNVHEYAISLGVAARMAKEIELKDNRLAHLAWTVGLPIVAHYSRPGYLNYINRLDPDDKPGADFFSNSTTSFIGKYFRVNSRLTYDYALTNGNILMLAYQWDYYKMASTHPVWFAEHTLSLSLMFNY
jgi:hypothetical protein